MTTRFPARASDPAAKSARRELHHDNGAEVLHGVPLKNDGFVQAVIDPIDIKVRIDNDPSHN